MGAAACDVGWVVFARPIGSATGVTDTSKRGQGKTRSHCLVMVRKEAS